jgi:hypothetical protein
MGGGIIQCRTMGRASLGPPYDLRIVRRNRSLDGAARELFWTMRSIANFRIAQETGNSGGAARRLGRSLDCAVQATHPAC